MTLVDATRDWAALEVALPHIAGDLVGSDILSLVKSCSGARRRLEEVKHLILDNRGCKGSFLALAARDDALVFEPFLSLESTMRTWRYSSDENKSTKVVKVVDRCLVCQGSDMAFEGLLREFPFSQPRALRARFRACGAAGRGNVVLSPSTRGWGVKRPVLWIQLQAIAGRHAVVLLRAHRNLPVYLGDTIGSVEDGAEAVLSVEFDWQQSLVKVCVHAVDANEEVYAQGQVPLDLPPSSRFAWSADTGVSIFSVFAEGSDCSVSLADFRLEKPKTPSSDSARGPAFPAQFDALPRSWAEYAVAFAFVALCFALLRKLEPQLDSTLCPLLGALENVVGLLSSRSPHAPSACT
jgi:hypothetical protein